MIIKALRQFWFCVGIATFAAQVFAADLRVMISAGFYGVYEQMAPEFERQTGYKLITTRGPSIGDSPEAIPTRLAGGQQADLVILDGESAENLAKLGFVKPDSIAILAFSQIGAAIKQGTPKLDISNVEQFRKTLLAAKSIAYSDSGSGTYIANQMFGKLGIQDQVKDKSIKVRGPPSGESVAAVVARGEAEIGFQQVSEIIHTPGITYLGPIPKAMQPGFSFAAGVTSNSIQAKGASELIQFLSAPSMGPVISKAGLIPAR
ncbi:ABC transporter substrate-binding protein [Polynucleobacter tropicus]|uniref:ABC transporter substrate-binding protein n=1 Tax=Polynucleobacter tropicus TaxID=1743174 RepID=A0A6M9Q6D3_9BURK|nr:substrate-binding domain-containing protein [Polynucleobacter tropicus]QKM64363.1 ABC transporter substrate-binding protein [Polynucleobacter tropicus]